MKKWIYLAGAIGCEVSGSLSLKAALQHPAWLIIVFAGFLTAFVFLSMALRLSMPLGIAYGIWGAAGVALTAVFSSIFFEEPLTPIMLAGIVLIMIGVLTIEIGSQQASKKNVTL